MNPDGSDVVQLTDNKVQDLDPAWQPVMPNSDPSDKTSSSPQPTEQKDSGTHSGFYPQTYAEGDRVIMPVRRSPGDLPRWLQLLPTLGRHPIQA